MTTLQKQLSLLANPQETSIFNNEKQRVSFLFDPAEAATIEPEVIYGIGLNGIEELCSIDSSFFTFYSKLFDEKIMNYDRRLRSKSDNDDINLTIRTFLLKLSPYFLLTCSHKVIEWLIYRLYIHLFNKEDFIAMIIPYHETKSFVRALQVLNLGDETCNWNWLSKVQQSGSPLSRSAIVSRLSRDGRFFGFICKLALDHSKKLSSHGVFYSFYSSRILSALKQMKTKRVEPCLVQLLPFLVHGICCENSNLYRNSSYILIGYLVVYTNYLTFSHFVNFIQLFVSRKFDNIDASELNIVIKLVSLMFQKDESLQIDEKIFDFLLNIPKIAPQMISLYKNGCTALTVSFLEKITNNIFTDSNVEQNFQILCSFFTESFMSPQHQCEYLKNFLSVYNEDIARGEATELIKIMEKTYKQSYGEIVTALQLNDEIKWKLARLSIQCSMENRFLVDSETTLFLAFNDPNISTRFGAIMELAKNIEENNVNDEFVKSVILDSFNFDLDNMDYIIKLLSTVSPHRFVNALTLFDSMCSLLNRIGRDDIKARHELLVCLNSLLVHYDLIKEEKDKFKIIFYYDLLVFDGEDNWVLSLWTSKIFEINTTDRPKRRNKFILQDLSDIMNNMQNFNFIADKSERTFLFNLICLGYVCANGIDDQLSGQILSFVNIYEQLKINEIKKIKIEGYNLLFSRSNNCFKEIAKNIFSQSSQFVPKCVVAVFNLICKNINASYTRLEFDTFWTNFVSEHSHFVFAQNLTHLVVAVCRARSKKFVKLLLNELINIGFESNYNQTLLFINHLIFSSKNYSPDKLDFDCLTNLSKTMLKIVNFESWMASETNINFVVLLISNLSCPNVVIRKIVFDILEFIISPSSSECNALLSTFIKHTFTHRDAIINSEENYINCLEELFAQSKTYLRAKRRKIKEAGNDVELFFLQCCKHRCIYFVDHLIRSLPSNGVKTLKFVIKKFMNYWENENSSTLPPDALKFLENLITKLRGSLLINLIEDIIKLLKMPGLPSFAYISLIEKLTSNVTLINDLHRNDDYDKLKFAEDMLTLRLSQNISTDSQLVACFYDLFHSLDLPLDFFKNHLSSRANPTKSCFAQNSNKRQTANDSINVSDDPEAFNIAIELLATTDSLAICENAQLIPILFGILKSSPMDDYTLQLVLSCINKILEIDHILQNISEFDLDINVVIKVMGLSKYAAVHQRGLAVLISISKINPNLMLANLIDVFTFIGRFVGQMSSYLMDLVDNLIVSLIPLLFKNEYDYKEVAASVANIFHIFLDSLPDIPSHHLRPILNTLTRVLGGKRFLSFIYLLVCELDVTSFSFGSLNNTLIENILVALSFQFSIEVILESIGDIIEFCNLLPQEWSKNILLISTNPTKCRKFDSFSAWLESLNVRATETQYQKFREKLVSFVISIFQTKFFPKMTIEIKTDSQQGLECLDNVERIIELSISKIDSTSTGKKFLSILSLTIKMLPVNFVIETLSRLVCHPNMTVKCRSLELFHDFVQREENIFTEQRDDLILLIETLCDSFYVDNVIIGDEKAQKTLFLILKNLSKGLTPLSESQIKKITSLCVKAVEFEQTPIVAGAFLCMGEVVSAGEYSTIPFVNTICHSFLSFVSQKKHILFNDKSVFMSAFICLERIVRDLTQFMSNFVLQFIDLIVDWRLNSEFGFEWTSLNLRLDNIKVKIAQSCKTGLILEAVENAASCLNSEQTSIAENRLVGIFEILQIHFKNFDSAQAEAVLDQLLPTLLSIWNKFIYSELSGDSFCVFLKSSIDATTLLVLKLSEYSFRPFFMGIWSWALGEDQLDEKSVTRMLCFYSFCRRLSVELKTIFLIFVNIFHDSMISLLLSGLSDNEPFGFVRQNLFISIFDCLCTCFGNSNSELLPRTFSVVKLGRILVDFTFSGKLEGNLVTRHLVPAISQYFQSYDDENEWQNLCQHILSKTKNNLSESNVCVTFDLLDDICKKLSQRFTVIIPPVVPFVAEMIEDCNEVVSKRSNDFALLVEEVCGESISSYF